MTQNVNGARTVLGPLTTTFTPSPACTGGVAQCNTCNIGWQGQRCFSSSGNPNGVEDDPGCWPPRSGTAATGTSTAPLAGWGFYSPGLICPSGFTSACSATGGGTTGWPVQFSLLPQETAVGCCPVGYRCVNNLFAQTCIFQASATSFPIVTCQSGTSGAFSYYTLPATVRATRTSASRVSVTAATITEYDLYAPLIQINWQASDLPSTSSSTSRKSQTTITSTSSSTPQPSSAISTGAKAGIGVGVTLAVVAIGVISWLLYQRRKQTYSPAPPQSPLTEIGGDGVYEMHGGKRGGHDPVELPGNNRLREQGQIAELDT